MTWSQMNLLSRAIRVADIEREEAALDVACAATARERDVRRFRNALSAQKSQLMPKAMRRVPIPVVPAATDESPTAPLPKLQGVSISDLERVFGKVKEIKLSPEEWEAFHAPGKRPSR